MDSWTAASRLNTVLSLKDKAMALYMSGYLGWLWWATSLDPLWIAAGMLLICYAASKLYFLHRGMQAESPAKPVKPSVLTEIVRKNFVRETVSLDGNHFVNCVFDDCTITFTGGNFHIDQCDIGEDCRLSFLCPEAVMAVSLMHMFSLLQTDEKRLLLADKYNRLIGGGQVIEKQIIVRKVNTDD